jgi:hypothetical protein
MKRAKPRNSRTRPADHELVRNVADSGTLDRELIARHESSDAVNRACADAASRVSPFG